MPNKRQQVYDKKLRTDGGAVNKYGIKANGLAITGDGALYIEAGSDDKAVSYYGICPGGAAILLSHACDSSVRLSGRESTVFLQNVRYNRHN